MRWQVRGHIADHILSRSVRDTALMLDTTGIPQAASPYPAPPKVRPYAAELDAPHYPLRIAWSSENAFDAPVDPEVASALQSTASLLEALGHDVRCSPLKVDFRTLYGAHRDAYAAGFSAKFKRIVERKGREPDEGEIGPLGRRLYEHGKRVSGIGALDALQTLRTLSWGILEQFEKIDVYVTPVIAQLPPRIDDLDPVHTPLKTYDERSCDHFGYTLHFNVTGQPSLSLPLWESEGGLPIGILFTARYGDEGTLIRLAAQLERARPWLGRRPPHNRILEAAE